MLTHEEFECPDYRNIPTIRTNKQITYYNIAAGFDIETTSIKQGETKLAFMYLWALSVGDSPVYYGRCWDSFVSICELLKEALLLDEENRLVVYVHNLGYEFQFMRKHFTWLEVFAVAERKPIKALCDLGIEFRDSYILSGQSLANTAKNLTKKTIKKLVGDLDYSLARTPETPLTTEELAYCENDVLIIIAYINEQIEIYGDVAKIPLTNTGRVRKFVKDECYYTSKNHRKSSKGKYYKYRQIMEDLTIDPETYIQLKRSFMGGFTHANANYSGKTLEKVSSIDFTSSYPSVMVAEKFPMSRFKSVRVEDEKHLEGLCQRFAMLFDVKFHNVRPAIEQENYLSESKCSAIVKPIINNGRVAYAETLTTTLTDVDFTIMKQSYKWDSMELASVKYAHKNYLPKPIVKSILDLYQGKTTLKDVEGMEAEYLLSKGMLNSIYGMCVTDIVKDNSVYFDDWGVERVDIETEIKNYNEAKGRFLYYPWGVWVTAYARRNLWTGIIAAGGDYVYSDTDSLKVLNYDKLKDYVEWYDRNIIDKMVNCCEHHNLDVALLSPKTRDGVEKMLGVWDFEGTYDRFKTLGAKRYLTQTGDKLALTVAGLSKQNGLKYMIERAPDISGVFEMFTDSLYIPAERTGKMTHTYIDDDYVFKCVDYLGAECEIYSKSAIHLEPCDFTLSIAAQYSNFLQQLSKGYIFKGVKHI